VTLDSEIRELFERPNYGHLATLLRDGSPHSVPLWVDMEGDRVCFFTQTGSQKAKNLARDPRVAISILDQVNPYRMATVRGRVTETLEGEEALKVIDRLARKFTGEDFPMRSGNVYLVEVEHVANMTLPFRPRPAA